MRAYPETATVPKPLLDVADQPVVRRVMGIYAQQGFTDFVLAAGYRHDLVKEFVEQLDEAWRVDVVDTGEDTGIGARILALRAVVADTFFVTYGDGLGNVDVRALLAFHSAHGGRATMTTVAMRSQYGLVDFGDNGRVTGFREKPVLDDHFINAGFFVFDQSVFDVWPEPGEDFEGEVLPALAETGELFAYRHHGFWRSMDTYKDALELTALCVEGAPPWERL